MPMLTNALTILSLNSPLLFSQFFLQMLSADFPWPHVERGSFIAILIWVQQSHEKRVDRITAEHRDAWVKAMDCYQDTLEKMTAAHAQLVELVRRGYS
jgi:hypothetical protein